MRERCVALLFAEQQQQALAERLLVRLEPLAQPAVFFLSAVELLRGGFCGEDFAQVPQRHELVQLRAEGRVRREAERGLPALERLLYPTEPLPTDPCPLIQVTADDLAATATALSADWGPYGDLLLTAGQPGNSRFLKPDEATQALFTQLATGLETLADRRIGRPLGTFDKPRPDLAEAHASARSVRNITLQLTALRGLATTLAPDSPKTQAAFDKAIALAEGLDPDIDHITDPQAWLKLEILQQAVRSTRDTALAELGPALGVALGFNSQDGD